MRFLYAYGVPERLSTGLDTPIAVVFGLAEAQYQECLHDTLPVDEFPYSLSNKEIAKDIDWNGETHAVKCVIPIECWFQSEARALGPFYCGD